MGRGEAGMVLGTVDNFHFFSVLCPFLLGTALSLFIPLQVILVDLSSSPLGTRHLAGRGHWLKHGHVTHFGPNRVILGGIDREL